MNAPHNHLGPLQPVHNGRSIGDSGDKSYLALGPILPLILYWKSSSGKFYSTLELSQTVCFCIYSFESSFDVSLKYTIRIINDLMYLSHGPSVLNPIPR